MTGLHVERVCFAGVSPADEVCAIVSRPRLSSAHTRLQVTPVQICARACGNGPGERAVHNQLRHLALSARKGRADPT